MRLSSRVGIVVFTLASCALATYLRIQEVSAEKQAAAPSELFDTIQTHLLALRAKRYKEAYLQASSRSADSGGIESFLETARSKSSIVRQALRWEFGMITEEDFQTDVDVRFFLPGGESQHCVFTVVRENRAWKIDGISFSSPTSPRSLTGLRL
jgi:hypothetical protein